MLQSIYVSRDLCTKLAAAQAQEEGCRSHHITDPGCPALSQQYVRTLQVQVKNPFCVEVVQAICYVQGHFVAPTDIKAALNSLYDRQADAGC